MQPDEFRFLGSLNYCLKRFHYFIIITSILICSKSPVSACTTETEISACKVLNMDILLTQMHHFNSEGLY